MAKYSVAGIGEILWDEFPDKKRLGGAPANFAFHAGQMGANASIISRIGHDPPGDKIKSILKQKQISYEIEIDPVFPTGRVSVKMDKKGSPEYIIHENAAWDFITINSKTKMIAQSLDAVCYGTLAQRNKISADSIQKFIHSTKENTLKVFDINLRQHYYSKKNISTLMAMANVLKLNDEELYIVNQMFLSAKEESACLKELKSLFSLDTIILTKGKDGSRIFNDPNNDSWSHPDPVPVADSVGAGDAYTAAAIMGLLNGFDLDQINKMANSVAAYVCSQDGATPAIPQKLIQPFISAD